MREASPGVRLGRELPRRPAERYFATAYFLFAMQEVSALFSAQFRLVPGETVLCSGERRETDLAPSERDTHQPQKPGETLR